VGGMKSHGVGGHRGGRVGSGDILDVIPHIPNIYGLLELFPIAFLP
jgi:hypothetical protein